MHNTKEYSSVHQVAPAYPKAALQAIIMAMQDHDEGITPTEWGLFHAYHLEGLTVRDIAEYMDQDPAYIHGRICEATAKIQDRAQPYILLYDYLRRGGKHTESTERRQEKTAHATAIATGRLRKTFQPQYTHECGNCQP